MAAETIVDATSFSEARMRSPSDPLARALRPPDNESPEARDDRLKAEAKAKKVSDDIDEQLKQERSALRKRKEVKVLLLGQSESGKSTTLKRAPTSYTLSTVKRLSSPSPRIPDLAHTCSG